MVKGNVNYSTQLMQLEMYKHIIGTTKGAPAALNRFVYYGDHLVKMPGPNPSFPAWINLIRNAYTLLTEPIFKGALSAFAEPWVQPRPTNMTDESVGDFIQRRFGKTVADNVASAFFHGIYAGDLYKLSARTVLPALWYMETRDPQGNGILGEMTDIALRGHGLLQFKHGRYMDLLEAAAEYESSASPGSWYSLQHDISVYTFGFGVEQMTRRMQDLLQEKANVKLLTGTEVSGVTFDRSKGKIAVASKGSKDVSEHDYVVSTLSPGKLREFMVNSTATDEKGLDVTTSNALENSNKAVSVAVVNLYYSNPNLIPAGYSGFGYLIPRSVDLEQNPERALGVIFGSEISGVRGKDAQVHVPNPAKRALQDIRHAVETRYASMGKLTKEQEEFRDNFRKEIGEDMAKIADEPDEVDIRQGQDTAPGTKLTVMLGGHWWDGWTKADLPDEEQCIDMAKTVLARHLKIMEAPDVAKARVNRDCIPQYLVGYRQRMASVHHGLMKHYDGRLKVAGAWWQGGVGLNDCILNAHLTALNIREGWDTETGLKEYTEQEKWLIGDRRTRTFTIDSGKDRSR